MRGGFVWIASAALLGVACAASAKVPTTAAHPGVVGIYNDRIHLVRDEPHPGAIRGPEESVLAASVAAEECRVQEPSKLGLLRSNVGTGSKKVLCRKLKT